MDPVQWQRYQGAGIVRLRVPGPFRFDSRHMELQSQYQECRVVVDPDLKTLRRHSSLALV
jgi:hypothetical protein